MTISAKIICDSITPWDKRITTFELTYPRFIHSEFMTHRVFSRNASSSRAIPIRKQIELIRNSTAMPIHWGAHQSGMQAEKEINTPVELLELEQVNSDGQYADVVNNYTPRAAWCKARDNAIEVAEAFLTAGYHKQVVNRLLEPFAHITVLVTATSYNNFFHLRCHKDAQPEIQELAKQMYAQYISHRPNLLQIDEWHLPFIKPEEYTKYSTEVLLKFSVARCARLSYLTHGDDKMDTSKDLALYDRLVGSSPLHASPAEHQAKVDRLVSSFDNTYKYEELSGNFDPGFIQYRKTLDDECIYNYKG